MLIYVTYVNMLMLIKYTIQINISIRTLIDWNNNYLCLLVDNQTYHAYFYKPSSIY